MYIKQSFIDRLKDQAEITEIVGHYAQDLKRRGSNLFCCSPLGQERTPSFCVDPVKQRFVDYHTDKSGDVISFIMEKENLAYPQAIEHLAGMVGMAVEYEDEEWAKEKAKQHASKDSLRPLLKAAHKAYQEELKKNRSALIEHQAVKELNKRSYTDYDITDWGLGYAPGGRFIWDQLQPNQLEQARELFLIGDKADKYWDRLIIPIHDESGLLIGFAGRDLSLEQTKKTAKWINPANTPLYKKDKVWFALHRAKDHIRKSGEAWILEGYNDVIAWHKGDITNTIAPCGTSITDSQIRILKRYCSKVIFCFDPDIAGTKAAIRQIPLFMAAGFQVEVCSLPSQGKTVLDPDDFSRAIYGPHGNVLIGQMLMKPNQNGFKILMNHYLQGKSELEKASGGKLLVGVVAGVKDEALKEIYQGWLTKESGLKPTTISKWLKAELNSMEVEKEPTRRYQLPTSVKIPLKDLLPDIEKYGMFVANDQIWIMSGKEKPYTFTSISNFSIEIIQHMQDEKLPMKLVRIRNIHGEERIFDTPSENLNTPQAFDNTMTNHGNFRFDGGRNELLTVRHFLFDRMGVGQKIEILGWQNENFWVWNNGITIPGHGHREIDENGVFKYIPPGEEKKQVCYYIPSANRIYLNNSFKFSPQKKVLLKRPEISFSAYISKMMEVHRSHAISGTLFTIASTFLDIIEDRLGNFPLLFLYGPASSGKDQLIDCCQSFYGDPQTPIHIGNKISTSKAQVRKFAQFRNMIVHLSEYRPGDQMLDELLKGFWDRRGYERGTIDSAYGTETVPIHSSVIFTGNHYPDDDALITRFICEEMTKTEFTQEEKKQYQELKDLNQKGISGFTEQLLQHRPLWVDKFKETYRKVESDLKKDLTVASSHDRMIGNVAVLGTAYELMKDVIQFPFAWNDFLSHIRKGLDSQVRKLNTASVSVKWWDCFLASVRTKTDPLKHGREFELRDNKLYFNFNHCYNRVIVQWWAQYHEQVPSKSKITDMLKKDSSFLEEKNSHRMEQKKTSVWVIDMQDQPFMDDLHDAIDWQRIESGQSLEAPNPYQPPKSKRNDQLDLYSQPLAEPDEDLPF